MILFLMLTAMIAYMVWTEKRILGGRFDFCCCCCGRDPEPQVVSGVCVRVCVTSSCAPSGWVGVSAGVMVAGLVDRWF
jgi:hypothetical protein